MSLYKGKTTMKFDLSTGKHVEVDVEVTMCQYNYGEDADGNRDVTTYYDDHKYDPPSNLSDEELEELQERVEDIAENHTEITDLKYEDIDDAEPDFEDMMDEDYANDELPF